MTKTSHMVYGKVSNNKECVRSGLNKRARYGSFRLHHLPPDIICDIFSRLRFKEAARTSMVSRSWRTLWRCYPNLVFTRQTMLHGNITDDHMATFISRVNNILWQLWSSSLKNFIVKFPLLGRDANHIDEWVSFSVASRARQIVLNLCPEEEDTDMNDMYSFPLHIFSGDNCVRSLSLGFVSLTLPPHLSGFTNLKKLGLDMVSIRGDLQCLLSQCDVIEWLSLTHCSLQHRSICQKLRRLRYLCVRKCRLQKLDLQAPNLTEFELTNYPIPIVLRECLNLSVATIKLVSFSDCLSYVAIELPAGGLYHVQDRLSINMTVRTESRGFAESIGRFNNLKHLILNIDVQGSSDNGSGILRLASLLEMAPCLEELELNMYCPSAPIYTNHQLDKFSSVCLHKHLRTVRMTGFNSTRGQLELAFHILRSAPNLDRLIVDPMVRVAWGPRLDWSQQHLMIVARMMAELDLLRSDEEMSYHEEDMVGAFALLYHQVFSYIKPMAGRSTCKCVVGSASPTRSTAGGTATLADIAADTGVHASRLTDLRCLMKLLTTSAKDEHGVSELENALEMLPKSCPHQTNNAPWQYNRRPPTYIYLSCKQHLLRSSSSLKNFIVKFPILGRDAHHIDGWVSFCAASRARQILVDICPEEEDTDMNGMYNFPLHIFSGDNCVRSLFLGFVSLTLPPHLGGFTNLKKLALHMVSIRGDLQCLLSQCDVMEWLSLTHYSLQHRSICQKLRRLGYLCVRKCRLQKLDLQAPNLTEFELTNYLIPIFLHECLNLSVATIELVSFSDCLSYVATELPAGGLYRVQDRLFINMTVRTEVNTVQELAKSKSIGRFNNLKHLILNIDVQGSDNGSGILHLASLLEMAPCLEELELNAMEPKK
uniref:F-box domain-containing protein n=1 Tax=Oryza punctata TaxID=4537 RepID=A0A0E0MG30_ORYPU